MKLDPEHEFTEDGEAAALEVIARELREAIRWYEGFGGGHAFTGWSDETRTEVLELLRRTVNIVENNRTLLLDYIR